MKSLFKEFYPLTDGEYEELWRDGLIVLDTNVLLRLFRYKEQTANDLLFTLEKLNNQLWIPNQVAWEFHRRRLTKIDEGRRAYKDVIEVLRKSSDSIGLALEAFKGLGLHPVVDLENPVSNMREKLSELISEVEEKYTANPPHAHYVRLLDRITQLYEGKVGEGFSEEEIEKIYKEGKIRYEAEVPPGFMDIKEKKDRPARELYGDLLIWKETLRHARQLKKGVILVTEDQKRDWWERTVDGRTIGPLPALRREFLTEIGQVFHLYRVDQFLEWASSRMKVSINPESPIEIREESKINQIVEQNTDAWYSEYMKISNHKPFLDESLKSIRFALSSEFNENFSPSQTDQEKDTSIEREMRQKRLLELEVSALLLKSELDHLDAEILDLHLKIRKSEMKKDQSARTSFRIMKERLAHLIRLRTEKKVKAIDLYDEIEDINAGII